MKIGVLQYPGGHGENELIYVFRSLYGIDVELIWHADPKLNFMDILFLGGGFPCQESAKSFDCPGSSALIENLNGMAAANKIIVGVGNGFQLLCHAGLLKGRLEKNHSGRFICQQVFIKPDNQSTPFTRALDQEEIFKMPIATYLGKYVASDEVLMEMRLTDQIIFRFCNYEGQITESVNYTGSTDNIAGICNPEKNVFGIIPRPERSSAEFGSEGKQSDILKTFLNEVMN